MLILTALVVSVAFAAWTYRLRLTEGPVRLAAMCRAVGVAALLVLLLDPGLVARISAPRAVVLLDNSVSMHGAGGRHAAALAAAAALGDTTSFGVLAPGEPGGHTAVAPALNGAVAGGRPVVIVTDGEVSDMAAVPADVLAQTAVRLFARPAGNDVAIVEVRGSQRLAAGDSLVLDVEALAVGQAPDTASVEVRDGERVVLRGTLRFGDGPRARARVRLAGVVPDGVTGTRWLTVTRTGAPDAEPADDARLWRIVVTPTPGVVVLAASPDWDARFLYNTLRDVVETPIRGYVQLEPGSWRRMDDLRRVPVAEVLAAARGADLLAVRGDSTPWRAMGRTRLLWVPSDAAGDWYLGAAGASPIAGAFAGVDVDSLPPATAARPLDPIGANGWTGAVAKLSRRGADVPVIGGRDGPSGRVVLIGVDGLYRWGFRGGASEQVWRTMVADAASWLLATPDAAGARARVLHPVTQRGRAVRFQWTGVGAALPVAIAIDGGRAQRADTLRFDGAGEATLALPVGRYQYRLDRGGAGAFAVEPYADELVPSPVTLTERVAEARPAPARRSLRELIWLFGVVVGGFGGEWMVRRKLGMR